MSDGGRLPGGLTEPPLDAGGVHAGPAGGATPAGGCWLLFHAHRAFAVHLQEFPIFLNFLPY